MANMSAAEVLKAELAGLSPVKPSKNSPPSSQKEETKAEEDDSVPGLQSGVKDPQAMEGIEPQEKAIPDPAIEHITPVKRKFEEGPGSTDDADAEGDVVIEEEDEVPAEAKALKVNSDGTVEQEDTVKYAPLLCGLYLHNSCSTSRLWEPGYKERYYQQKFGVEPEDKEFRRKIAECYVQGLAWVLCYYYQGVSATGSTIVSIG
jgi:5'-3' exoribonuclease 2